MDCLVKTRFRPLLVFVSLSLSGGPAHQARGYELSFTQSPTEAGPTEYVVHGTVGGIRIEHRGAWESCCLEFEPIVNLEGRVLRIAEADRGPLCGCPVVPWDLFVEIQALEAATYDVYLSREGGSLLATAQVTVPATPTRLFVRGRINADEVLDISDGVALLNHLFAGERGPLCADAADVNDDGVTDVSDAIYLLDYLFAGGPQPRAPFPHAAEDPTPDDVACSLENSVLTRDFARTRDLNGDGVSDISDGIAFLDVLLGGGPAPPCWDAVDANDDGAVDLGDWCFLCPPCCPYLWIGPPPPLPEPRECGPDPTPDPLSCPASRCGG